VTGEYGRLLRDSKSSDTEIDASLSRLDFSPQIPLSVQEMAVVHGELDGSWRETFTRAAMRWRMTAARRPRGRRRLNRPILISFRHRSGRFDGCTP